VGGLAPAELATIRGRLEAFADVIFASLPRTDQRARGQCYLRGLMLDGRRKSIQPMAARLGEVHYQALHHFVAASPWDWRPVSRRLAEVLTAALQPAAWVVDDTGFPKDGTHSVGGQAPVLRHAGQDRQLPAGGVGQRGDRARLVSAFVAAVRAPELGR
jgi:SRSO17 transposase